MFKIGNSKELPAIPDHLSEEGKDFIWQCLQRNPLHRPTASRLLEHPFVKSASLVERPISRPEPSDPSPGVTVTVRSQVLSHSLSCYVSKKCMTAFKKSYLAQFLLSFINGALIRKYAPLRFVL